jgi:hypothetical protein
VLLDLTLFLDFFETFCEDVSRNKLCIRTTIVFFGPMDQKYGCLKFLGQVWVGRRSLGIGHLTNYGQKPYFWTFLDFFTRRYDSAGRRDINVSAESAGRRLYKNRKFKI